MVEEGEAAVNVEAVVAVLAAAAAAPPAGVLAAVIVVGVALVVVVRVVVVVVAVVEEPAGIVQVRVGAKKMRAGVRAEGLVSVAIVGVMQEYV